MTTGDYTALGLEVPVGAIDGELRKLWDADQAQTNASLMNLAVYSEEPGALQRNSEVIRELTQEHACRAILIEMDRKGAEPAIHSWITAHCHLAHGKKSVCCEQLAFRLVGHTVGRMRNTVFAHLASDLPLVFWWQGELSSIFEERLYRSIDRFVFDSAEWAEPTVGFARIREAAEDTGRRIVLQDLSWTRTYHFRLAVAALFDDLVAQRAMDEIESVRIVAEPDQRVAAVMLLSWLATQAGWRIGLELGLAAERISGCTECFVFESRSGGTVKVQLEWNPDGAPLGLLEINAPGCTVSVSREAGAEQLLQRLECPGRLIEQNGAAEEESQAGLVANQLARAGKDSLFRKIWPMCSELLGG